MLSRASSRAQRSSLARGTQRRRGLLSVLVGSLLATALSAAAWCALGPAWLGGPAAPPRGGDSRRQHLLALALAGAAAGYPIGTSRAEAFEFGIPKPIAFDYRTARQLDPSKRVITGDVNSEPVRAAVAFLKGNREKAEAAATALKTNPLADINENFGLVGKAAKGDNMLSNIQTNAGLDGVYAGPAQELRKAVKAINDIMDDRTRADTERVSRMMISKWYSIVTDPNTKPLEEKDPTKRYIAETTRKSEKTQASLQQKIFNYQETIDFLLRWVE